MRCEPRRCVGRGRLDLEGVGVGVVVVVGKGERLLVLVGSFRLVGEGRSGTALVSTFLGLRWLEAHFEAVDVYPLERLLLSTARD